jgi:hypothetical protein
LVADYSAGCSTLATQGDYQKLTKILLESGQLWAWIHRNYPSCFVQSEPGHSYCLNLALATVRGARRNALTGGGALKYVNSDVPYIDNKFAQGTNPYSGLVYTGRDIYPTSVRFPFLLLDSRDLSDPDPKLGN